MEKIVGLVVARAGVIRDGYQTLISAIPGVEATEPADSGPSALARLEEDSQYIIILDSSLTIDETKEALAKLMLHKQKRRSLVIRPTRQEALEMVQYGADMVLVDGIKPADLVVALKTMVKDPCLSDRGPPGNNRTLLNIPDAG